MSVGQALLAQFVGSAVTPEIDFAADTPVITQDALSKVTLVAQQLIEAKDDVADYEKKLSTAKESVKRLEERDLPEAMAEAKVTEFKLTNGKQVTVKDIVAGAPSKENFPTALAWLRGHDHDGIVKRAISIQVLLPKGQDKLGAKLVAYLKRLKTLKNLGVEPKDEPTVHYQTFGSWARELFTKHNEEHLASATVDQDCPFCNEETTRLLGIYVGKKAEIRDVKK